MLQDAEVEELPKGQRLETVTQKRVAIEDDLPCLDDPSGQRNRRIVEDHEVHLVRSEMTRRCPQRVQLRFEGVRSRPEINRNVNVAEGLDLSGSRAAKNIRKDNPRNAFQRLPECLLWSTRIS